MRKPHTLNAAETSIESFSKAIYDRLFTWIVGHVNSAIDPTITGIFGGNFQYFWRNLVFFFTFWLLFGCLGAWIVDWIGFNPIILIVISQNFRILSKKYESYCSGAASRWAGWALAHPGFGSSVNPITTRGADYAHHITASPSGFENPAAALYV